MATNKLIEVVVTANDPIVADAARLFEAEDVPQILVGAQTDMKSSSARGAWANFLFSFSMNLPADHVRLGSSWRLSG